MSARRRPGKVRGWLLGDRADRTLANESKDLGRGDLLRVFVNDIDEYLIVEAAAREMIGAGAA